ncbi:hypothetical protein ACK8OR_10360 [Jannaschia sp. KMU-145]|uniref:hypothetical protein n=1 Tax=Jannaschia halovivens TaxID=3388667 RepID=UPI00396B1572
MSKKWIIEVLGDLKGFADANRLPELASQLDEAIVTASVELVQDPPAEEARPDGTKAGRRAEAAG